MNIGVSWGLDILGLRMSLEGYDEYDGCLLQYDRYNQGTGNAVHFFIETKILKDENPSVREHFFKKLLQYTNNINLQNGAGQTPIMLACKMKDETAVKLLALDPKLKISHRDHNGKNLLHYLFEDTYDSCNIASLQEIRKKRLHIFNVFKTCILAWDIEPAIPGLMGGKNCPSKCAVRHRDYELLNEFKQSDKITGWSNRVGTCYQYTH